MYDRNRQQLTFRLWLPAWLFRSRWFCKSWLGGIVTVTGRKDVSGFVGDTMPGAQG